MVIMDDIRYAHSHVGIWSSKHYLIAANVNILLNVMLIFRTVLTKTVQNPIPVNWILTRRKRIGELLSCQSTGIPFLLELFFTLPRAPGKPSPHQDKKKDRSQDDCDSHGKTKDQVCQDQFPD